jgi:hypothetical protein
LIVGCQAREVGEFQHDMELKSKIFFFVKVVLVYLTILCLIVSINFLVHIGDILSSSNFTVIGGVFFLAIYLFISILNIIFLVRKKSIKAYKTVVLYNFIFSLISGIGLKIGDYLIINNVGADVSIVGIYSNKGPGFLFHYDLFNFIIKFLKDDPKNQGFGIEINLIMWTLGLFLLICYKKLSSVSKIPPSVLAEA